MVELSNRTRAHVRALFRSPDVELAERALITDCGDNLPLLARAGSDDLERVRFAALRLSGGRLDRLAKAVELAQTDWRDLLVARVWRTIIELTCTGSPGDLTVP